MDSAIALLSQSSSNGLLPLCCFSSLSSSPQNRNVLLSIGSQFTFFRCYCLVQTGSRLHGHPGLQINSTSILFTKSYHQLHLLSPSKSNLRIQSQNDAESSNQSPAPTKPSAPGLGFGSSSTSGKSASSAVSSKKKSKGRRDRASVIRRAPVQKPAFVGPEEEAKAEEQRKNESAFLLAWLGLGGIILVQGILLAASGFLPDEWDKFFVKYLYPSFTPTVFLFVAGTVTYGVLKYLQNESLKDRK